MQVATEFEVVRQYLAITFNVKEEDRGSGSGSGRWRADSGQKGRPFYFGSMSNSTVDLIIPREQLVVANMITEGQPGKALC